jgi:hypothetical protein
MYVRCPHCTALTLRPRVAAGKVVVTCTDCRKTFEIDAAELPTGAQIGDHVVVRR